MQSGKIKTAVAVFAPKPDYPKYARDRHWEGAGCFVLHVDQKTGRVKYVEILKSTGRKILDDEVTTTFSRWRFGPGVAPKVVFPITFSLTNR
jgi:periplasmic protein TonB